jgi:hypothetical protein
MEFVKEVTTTIGEEPKKTKLTIIKDEERAWDMLAIRSAVVAVQARWRSAGEVPAEYTIAVSELVGRRGRPAIDPVVRAKNDPAYRRRIIAQLMELEQDGGE